MPFGLRNAPATFQLLMQSCLSNLQSFSEPYIDDIVIFSTSWSDHLSHISQVLSRLSDHGLTVKLKKCLWGCTQFEFLGYVIGEGKLSIPPARLHQFQHYVKPKTRKPLKSFLGLCNYYRKFIPSFSVGVFISILRLRHHHHLL